MAAILIGTSAMADPTVVVNSGNADAIDSQKISSLLVGKRKFWDSGNEVIIAILKGNENSSKALQAHVKMDENRFKNHWQRLAFSGRGRMPKMFNDVDALVAFVKVNKGAIGITDSGGDLSSVKVVN